MLHRNHTTARRFAGLFLALLAFQMGLILPRTQWSCRCGEDYPHTSHCCCNCPKCVGHREGMLSYCSIRGPGQPDTGRVPSLESASCPCGLGGVVLNLPGDSPFLAAAGTGIPLTAFSETDPAGPIPALPHLVLPLFSPPG